MITFKKLKSKKLLIPLCIIFAVILAIVLSGVFSGGDEEAVKTIPQVKEYIAGDFVRIEALDNFGGVLPGIAYYFDIKLWILYMITFCIFMLCIFLDDFGDTIFWIVCIAYIAVWYFAPVIDYIPVDFTIKTGYDISNIIQQ